VTTEGGVASFGGGLQRRNDPRLVPAKATRSGLCRSPCHAGRHDADSRWPNSRRHHPGGFCQAQLGGRAHARRREADVGSRRICLL